MEYEIIKLLDKPELKDSLALWFHKKWNIPLEAYQESMTDCIMGQSPIPQWYGVISEGKIIAGVGIIENDFHNRKDLTPNVCALYVDKKYRCNGIAGAMLNYVCKDMKNQGIDTLYLITDYTSFYEKYGWKFLCMVLGDDEIEEIRMYVHQEC